MINKRYWLIFLLILVVASAIRFYNPTFRSLWGDEGHSVFYADAFNHQPFKVVMADLINDSHLPAYFLLLSAWIRGFGSGEDQLRLLSILIGIASIIYMYVLAKAIFNEKTALISAGLLAFSSLAVMHSQDIRMYGLMLLFSLLSTCCFWQILIKHGGRMTGLGYFFFSLLLLLTHIYGALLIAAQFACLLYAFWKEENRSTVIGIVLLQGIAVVLVSPFYFILLTKNLLVVLSGITDMPFAVFPFYLKLPLFFFVLTLGETVAPWNYGVVLPAVAVFFIAALGLIKLTRERRVVYLLILLFFPTVTAAVFLKPTMPKYLITVLPFYLMLIGYSISNFKSKLWGKVWLVIIIAAECASLHNYFNLREYHNANQIEPWREVSAQIKGAYRQGDIIIATKYYTSYRLLQYYLNGIGKNSYLIHCLQKSNYFRPEKNISSYFIYDARGERKNVNALKNKRVWLVSHILDDRTFPAGYVDRVREKVEKSYKLERERGYIPYVDTLSAKLPIKRHALDSSRIVVSLYCRRK